MKSPERANGGRVETELQAALHEVSNALTVVLGGLDDARKALPPGAASDALELAYAHAKRGHKIARRAIGARTDGDLGVRSALSIASDAVAATAREATLRGVGVEICETGTDAMVEGSDAVLQILINLLLNALAFSPQGSAVRLHVDIEAQVVFRVTDQGPGIAPELRARLFTPGHSMRPGGAGVGLSHSRDLAMQHQATLRLLDRALGAEFELRWPVSDAPSQTIQRPPRPEGIAGLRLIVLEDDAAVMGMVQFGLETRGAIVDTARTLAELTTLACNAVHYDAALVDFSPIQFDAARVLTDLQVRKPGLPIILISGSAVAPDEGLPLAAYVQKPFEVAELVVAIQACQR